MNFTILPVKMQRNVFQLRRLILCGTNRSLSNTPDPTENTPIKFTTSPAATRVIRPILINTEKDVPWYQPFSVVGSIFVFMFYFCVLREESDIDMEFSKTLYDRIKGLEKEQLLQTYRYNKENNLSVEAIEKRLKEMEIEEQNAVSV